MNLDFKSYAHHIDRRYTVQAWGKMCGDNMLNSKNNTPIAHYYDTIPRLQCQVGIFVILLTRDKRMK